MLHYRQIEHDIYAVGLRTPPTKRSYSIRKVLSNYFGKTTQSYFVIVILISNIIIIYIMFNVEDSHKSVSVLKKQLIFKLPIFIPSIYRTTEFIIKKPKKLSLYKKTPGVCCCNE